MLCHRYLIHPVPLPQGQGWNEPVEVAVQRESLRHRAPHSADTAGHIMEALRRHATYDAVKCTRLHSVEPTIHAGGTVGDGHIGPSSDGIEEEWYAVRLDLKVRGESENQVTAASLNPESEGRGFPKFAGEPENPEPALVAAQSDQLRRRGETTVEDQQKLVIALSLL
jgi:hypothetical protein